MSAGQRDERSPSKEHTSRRIQMQSSNRLEGLLERPVSGVPPMLLLLLLLPILAPSSPRSSTDSKLQLCEGTLKQILASHRGCDMRAPFVERTPYPQIRKPGCGLEHRALTAAGRLHSLSELSCQHMPTREIIEWRARQRGRARAAPIIRVAAGPFRLPHSAWDGLACLTG
jgi:hypothetical protein